MVAPVNGEGGGYIFVRVCRGKEAVVEGKENRGETQLVAKKNCNYQDINSFWKPNSLSFTHLLLFFLLTPVENHYFLLQDLSQAIAGKTSLCNEFSSKLG